MNDSSAYYRADRSEVMPLFPEQYSHVLEVGCAEGNFRGNLKRECEYWGIEPVQAVAEIASKRLDRVLIGSYREVSAQLPDSYFDLVICNDVIEHMVDPDEFFQSIKKKMKKEACLVGSIPNVRYVDNLLELLLKKDWDYKDLGILDRTHLRFFTEKSLKRTIAENGFVIEELRGINPRPFGRISIKGLLRRAIYHLAYLCLGTDVKFLQFGIRIRTSDLGHAKKGRKLCGDS